MVLLAGPPEGAASPMIRSAALGRPGTEAGRASLVPVGRGASNAAPDPLTSRRPPPGFARPLVRQSARQPVRWLPGRLTWHGASCRAAAFASRRGPVSAATLRLASTANGGQSLQFAAPLVHGRQHPKPLEVGQQRYPRLHASALAGPVGFLTPLARGDGRLSASPLRQGQLSAGGHVSSVTSSASTEGSPARWPGGKTVTVVARGRRARKAGNGVEGSGLWPAPDRPSWWGASGSPAVHSHRSSLQ